MSNPQEAKGFEWDDDEDEAGNTAHLAAHGISPWEAEEVYTNGGVLSPNKKEGSGDWRMIGATDSGRVLTLILVYRNDRRLIRVFTGWVSTTGERRRWYD